MREVFAIFFRKLFWITSIILFFLVFLSQIITGNLEGVKDRIRIPELKLNPRWLKKPSSLPKRKVNRARRFHLKAKWVLIPLIGILFIGAANFGYRLVMNSDAEIEQKPKELYLIKEASEYVENEELFEAGVKNIANSLEIPPEWLMAVMYMESRFNPAVENLKGSGAVGLIQFMVPTVKEINARLGRKLYMKDIQNMPAVEQLELVENYLQTVRRRRGEFNSLTDLYLAILYPKAINRGMSYKLFSKPSKRYRQNSGLDMNKDGIVQVSDIDLRMQKMFPTAYEIKKESIIR